MTHKTHDKPLTLLDIAPGQQAEISGFAADTDPDLHERLLAYGLIPGQRVGVLGQKPLTLVQIEHMELALERVLAACIQVKAQAKPGLR